MATFKPGDIVWAPLESTQRYFPAKVTTEAKLSSQQYPPLKKYLSQIPVFYFGEHLFGYVSPHLVQEYVPGAYFEDSEIFRIAVGEVCDERIRAEDGDIIGLISMMNGI